VAFLLLEMPQTRVQSDREHWCGATTSACHREGDMHRLREVLEAVAGVCAISWVALAASFGSAQQINGVPGSPSATMSINGKQLPAPPPKFGGVIKRNAAESTPWWPPRIVPPKGAPNVLLIMTDDVGFGAPSPFGGVIPTPALDRIAQSGLRYTQFHSTALCSRQ
jgi:arylsulfatase